MSDKSENSKDRAHLARHRFAECGRDKARTVGGDDAHTPGVIRTGAVAAAAVMSPRSLSACEQERARRYMCVCVERFGRLVVLVAV